MIGSRRKKRLIFDQFLNDQIATKEQLATVACPVGLPIDSRTVPEIAVSIVAQFVQERARSLREFAKGEREAGAPCNKDACAV